MHATRQCVHPTGTSPCATGCCSQLPPHAPGLRGKAACLNRNYGRLHRCRRHSTMHPQLRCRCAGGGWSGHELGPPPCIAIASAPLYLATASRAAHSKASLRAAAPSRAQSERRGTPSLLLEAQPRSPGAPTGRTARDGRGGGSRRPCGSCAHAAMARLRPRRTAPPPSRHHRHHAGVLCWLGCRMSSRCPRRRLLLLGAGWPPTLPLACHANCPSSLHLHFQAGVASGPYGLGLLSAASIASLSPLMHACLSLIALAAGAELHLPELQRLRKQVRQQVCPTCAVFPP